MGSEMLGLVFGAMGHCMADERAQLNSDEAGHLGTGERGDFILATYREIAAHFSLGGPNAARTKVKRAGWSAEPSNHPADPLHIRVPRDTWYQAADTSHPRRAERPHITENGETSQQFDTPDLKRSHLASSEEVPSQPDTPHITALEGHIASLQADLAAERARADRAEQARAAADARVDATMARADAADADRRVAEARAERAEQGRDAERAQADVLRDRVEAREADLALSRAALDQTQAEARKARAEVETLRQADAERKGRGRLERLRAAWRGE
jgi:hypothetical protein